MNTHVLPHFTFRSTFPIPLLMLVRLINSIYIPLPRRSVLIAAILFLGGLILPALMLFEILPANFLVAFIGLAMTATGGITSLVLQGEI